MKIICIGQNYLKHIRELNHQIPECPVFFMKPETSLLLNNRPFFLPDFSENIHYEVELVVKINKLGKHISKSFAPTYYDEIGLGIDFTAKDLQQKAAQKGLPWEISKSFDSSAAVGKFLPKSEFKDLNQLDFKLFLNDNLVQHGNSSAMIFKIDEIISYISQFVTLKIGDLIFTGTPAGVSKVAINDRLTGFLESEKMFEFRIK